MTALVALGPLVATPLVIWLLMEFGPERSVIFALWWIIPSIVFAVVMPMLRRRGHPLVRASAHGVAWGIGVAVFVFVVLLFGFTPRVGAVPATPPRVSDARCSARAPRPGRFAGTFGLHGDATPCDLEAHHFAHALAASD